MAQRQYVEGMYSTGEVARLCGITVRTVQYYDERGLVVPSGETDGGRRLYAEADVRRMRVVCFLRDLGLPIKTISALLAEDDPAGVIGLLLARQAEALREEVADRREKLERIEALQRELAEAGDISLESIGDIAHIMSVKEDLHRLRRNMILAAIPIGVLEIAGIVVWIATGRWWLFAAYIAVAIPWGVWFLRYYGARVAYICPQCHEVFKPALKEFFWAGHTPTTRRLTCPACGHRGFCVETVASAVTYPRDGAGDGGSESAGAGAGEGIPSPETALCMERDQFHPRHPAAACVTDRRVWCPRTDRVAGNGLGRTASEKCRPKGRGAAGCHREDAGKNDAAHAG